MVKYTIMKKKILFINFLLFILGMIISCATTNNETPVTENVIEEIEENQIEIISEPEPTAEELFLTQMEGIKIEFTKVPAKTKKNKAFGSSYELLVTDNDSPLADFEVILNVPEKKEGTILNFVSKAFTTDENGIITFTPATPDFAAETQITAYPAIPEGLEITVDELKAQTATAAYLCESDIVAKGAIMFVFEYNENGKSPKNSYDILSGLRKKGVYQIGNAPISDTDYINASKEKIYKENYEYVGTDFGYLIGGTVKFANPVEKNEDGTYTAHLIADIYGIDMKTGIVIYEEKNEYTSSGTNWNKAVESCKEKLTTLVVDSIMFGL